MTDDLVEQGALRICAVNSAMEEPCRKACAICTAQARAIIPLVQAAERERCARLAEGFAGLPNALLAAAIRAGGQP